MSVCPGDCPSTKCLFDFNEICHVGRGRWVIHDGMQYDPIQSQCHKPLKVGNPSIFKCCPLPFTMVAGSWTLILKLGHSCWSWIRWWRYAGMDVLWTLNVSRATYIWSGQICYIHPSFCIVWLGTWQKHHLRIVDCQSSTGLIYYCY